MDRGSPVAVLGFKTADELFRGLDPIGRTIRIGDRRARVIGVTALQGVQLGIDFDDVVIVPVASAMRLFNRSSLLRVLVRTNAYAELETTKNRVAELLKERHQGEEDFTLMTQDAVVSTLSTILTALTAALAMIAAISLSVAGIGIMNVMLVSVSERHGEVGLLKAVGARRRDILLAFLTEAALLSLAGAALGLMLGAALVWLVVSLIPQLPRHPAAMGAGRRRHRGARLRDSVRGAASAPRHAARAGCSPAQALKARRA